MARPWLLALALVGCSRGPDRPAGDPERFELLLYGHRVGVEERWTTQADDGTRHVEAHRRYRVRVGDRELVTEATERVRVDADGALLELSLAHEGARRTIAWDDGALVVSSDGDRVQHPASTPPYRLELARTALTRARGGETLSLPVVDGWTDAPVTATLRPHDGGVAWEAGGEQGVLLLDDDGDVVESASGGVVRRRGASRDDPPPVDLLALLGRPVDRIEAPRRVRTLVLDVHGADGLPDLHAPPLQVVDGARVKVQVPLRQEIARRPAEPSPDHARWLAPEPGIPSDDPQIIAAARDALAGVGDRRQALDALVRAVRERLDRTPVAGPPSALAALTAGEGDCNEHAALLVALARAAGIPARQVAGLVYLEVEGRPGLYLHAWAEVQTGAPAGWVPVDPVLGQAVADATHLRLVVGGPDAQRRILGALGDLRVTVVEAR